MRSSIAKNVLKKHLVMLSGEIGPEGAVIGKKGQFAQSLIFQCGEEDCTLEVRSGGKETPSEEVMDRLAGRCRDILLKAFPFKSQETFNLHIRFHLPITIIPSSKVRYVMEVVE